jgi:hypothetical protein
LQIPGLYQPPIVLFLGQASSIIFGGVLIFCGFDTLASKYASYVSRLLKLIAELLDDSLFPLRSSA